MQDERWRERIDSDRRPSHSIPGFSREACCLLAFHSMVALLEDAGGSGASVVLGRHGGGNTMMGACASSSSTALVTVQGDGVIVYDCEAQVRLSLVKQGHAIRRAWPTTTKMRSLPELRNTKDVAFPPSRVLSIQLRFSLFSSYRSSLSPPPPPPQKIP